MICHSQRPAGLVAARLPWRGFAVLGRLGGDSKAVTALEYALIASVTAMVIVTGTALFGGDAVLAYGKISDALGGVSPASLPMTAGAGAAPAAPSTPAGPASSAPCLVGKDDCSGGREGNNLSGRMNSAY